MKARKRFLQLAVGLTMLSAIVLVLPAGDASAQACVAAPSQAISWWPGDGHTIDVAGGHTGSLAGSAAYGAGRVGQGFHFNGSGWVDVPDSPAFTLGTQDFTIELWAKFNSLTGLDPLIAHTDGGGPPNKWIFWFNSTGHDKQLNTPALRFMMNNSPNHGHDSIVAPWNPVVGQWYHLAVTRSGSTYRLYINGSLAATDTSADNIPDPHVPLTIGRAEAFRLNGVVDEPAIYSRALTGQEISDIASAGAAGKCKPAIPVPEYGWTAAALAMMVGVGAFAFARQRLL